MLPSLDDRKKAIGGTQPPLSAREVWTPAGVEELKQFGIAQRSGGETATAKLTYDLATIELRYDGATRLVEPYALTFKRRKDGGAWEYFYAYDQTGSYRSGPGIKSFLAPKVESLRLTDKSFEPRFEIELAKAGDAETAGYFSSTGGRRLIGVRRRRHRAAGPEYVVECSYCGKRFRRKTTSTRLNPHKDRYGNPCFGRIGHRVT